jgi:hypothetical protein
MQTVTSDNFYRRFYDIADMQWWWSLMKPQRYYRDLSANTRWQHCRQAA